jgi:hypothetical protein
VFADVTVRSQQTVGGQTSENTTYVKGKRQRAETMNGSMINITQCDLRRAIQMNPLTRTFIVNEFGSIEPVDQRTSAAARSSDPIVKGGRVVTTINVKDTGERRQMFGFQARRLVVTMDTRSTPDSCTKANSRMETDGWYADIELGFDCEQAERTGISGLGISGGCRDMYEFKQTGAGKRGYPLYEKTTMYDVSGKEIMSMVNEVVELSRSTLDQSLFDVPSDYREVKDPSQLYGSYSAVASNPAFIPAATDPKVIGSKDPGNKGFDASSPANAGSEGTIEQIRSFEKKEGTIRIGLSHVKIGSVGDAISAADLAHAVQITLIQYLKGPKIDVIILDARLSSAIESEAKEKECDYVLNATVFHKKGGGGFGGMFGATLGSAIARTGIGHTGSTVGNIAGQVATQAIVSATTVSSQLKAKDEISVDLKVNKLDSGTVLAKQYKAKARSDGEDILSQVIEQAAEAIAATLGI